MEKKKEDEKCCTLLTNSGKQSTSFLRGRRELNSIMENDAFLSFKSVLSLIDGNTNEVCGINCNMDISVRLW